MSIFTEIEYQIPVTSQAQLLKRLEHDWIISDNFDISKSKVISNY